MADVQITGYHTCKTEGGWRFVGSEAPFLSQSGPNQWLTQGYYFWVGSDSFAHKWGKDSYNNDYAILQCTLNIKEELLLDLVGSVQDQIYFNNLLAKFKSKIQTIDPSKEPTVQSVIDYWRKQAEKNNDVFPFVAIKVQDERHRSTLPFVGGRWEAMRTDVRRQQLCLFECGIQSLKEKKIIYPKNFIRS